MIILNTTPKENLEYNKYIPHEGKPYYYYPVMGLANFIESMREPLHSIRRNPKRKYDIYSGDQVPYQLNEGPWVDVYKELLKEQRK